MNNAFIQLSDVSLRYGGGTVALDHTSLDIDQGDFVALVGPSGCGKSTILKLVAGLLKPSSGAVIAAGREVGTVASQGPGNSNASEAPRLRVGLAFQNPTMLPWLTIRDNVMIPLKIVDPFRQDYRRKRHGEYTDRVEALLTQVGLRGFGDKRPWQLSGGMLQRASLCRALVHEPELLLLDEPFGALDAKVRKELRRWLRRLHDDLHVTSIFVTHDQEEALEVADRVVLMNSGSVEQIGSPQEVWDHPASPFVYGFLGDVNLFHGRAHEGEMRIGGDSAVSLNSPEHQFVQDSKAFAYVRPHDIEVKRYSTGDAGIKAKLTRAIVVGPIARLEFEPVDHHDFAKDTVIEAQLSSHLFAEQAYKEGETLVLTPRKARIFVEN